MSWSWRASSMTTSTRPTGPCLTAGFSNRAGGRPRLLAVANIPLTDPKKATVAATEAIEAGCAAVMVPSTPAGDLAPTHPDLDSFWDVLSESGTPFVLHVGGGGKLLDKAFHNNNM